MGRLSQYFSFFFCIPALFAFYDTNWSASIPFFCGGLIAFGIGKILSLPLRERTTYAVVVTKRLKDINGEAVGSPFPSPLDPGRI